MANGSDPFAEFEEASPASDEFSSFETATETPSGSFDAFASQEVSQLDLARDLDEDTLVEDLKFSPVTVAAQNQELILNNPALLNKLVSVYDKKNKRGTTLGEKVSSAVEAAPAAIGSAVRGAGGVAKRSIKLSPPGLMFQAIQKVIAGEPISDLKTSVLKDVSEAGASVETAVTGSSDLLRRTGRRLFKGQPEGEQELRNRFFDDVAFFAQTEGAAEGGGEILESAGLTEALEANGIELDAQAVEDMSFVTDPVNFIPLGGSVLGVSSKGARLIANAGRGVVGAERAAKIASAMNTAASSAREAIGKGAEAVGKGLGKIGKAASGAKQILGAGAGAGLVGGAFTPSQAVALYSLPTLFKGAGGAVSSLGRAIRGENNFIRRAARGTRGIISNPFTRGAAAGITDATALSLPFVIGARAEEEGAILGAGAALGGVAGATIGGGRAVHRAAIGELTRALETGARETVPYNTDGNLDAAHATQVKKLPQAEQNLVNAYREKMRDLFDAQGKDVEIYVVDPDTFESQTGNRSAKGFYQVLNTAQPSTASRPAGRDVVRILLNETPQALTHEAYHAFKRTLPEEQWRAFEAEVASNLTPAQLQQFSDLYNSSLNQGLPRDQWTSQLTPEQVIEEVSAEAASQILQGRNIENIAPSVAQRGLLAVAGMLETLGFNTGGLTTERGAGVSDLGVRPTARQSGLLTEAIQSIDIPALSEQRLIEREAAARATPGRAPTVSFTEPRIQGSEPASTPGEIPGAPVRSDSIENARRALNNLRDVDLNHILDVIPGDEAGIAQAREYLNTDPTLSAVERERGEQILQNIGNAVEIETLSARGDRPVVRRRRRAETEGTRQAELEGALPENLRDLVQKSTIPYRIELRRGTRGVDEGKIIFTVLAASPDKIVNNASNLMRAAKDKGIIDRVPYDHTPDGQFTEVGLRAFINDVRAYADNHAHGYAGDGSRITVPDNYEGFIPPEDPAFRSVAIPEANVNFINMAMGTPPPKTTKKPSGATAVRTNPITGEVIQAPANVEAQRLAEASGRELLEPSISTDDRPFRDFGTGIAEFNPLRNEFVEAGVDVRGLAEEFTERVRLDKIKAVRRAESAPVQAAPRPLLTQAGFRPAPVGPAELGRRRLGEDERYLYPVREAFGEFKQGDQVSAEDIRNAGYTVPENLDVNREQAGFFRPSVADPAAEIRRIAALDAENFAADMRGREGGLTGHAVDVGTSITDRALLNELQAAQDAAKAEGTAAMQAGDFNKAASIISKAQFFREAYEAATGTGSMGNFLRDRAQRAPFAKTRPPATPENVAQTMVKSFEENGGGTVDTKTGRLLNDEPVYVVSIYPERGIQLDGRNLTEETVRDFIQDNQDLLNQPENNLGSFFDESTGTTDVDVVVTTPSKDLALALGRRFNQKSIWDAQNKETIDTGGTGERVNVDIPESDRVQRVSQEQGFKPTRKKEYFTSKADQDSPPLTAKSWILPDGEFVPLKRWPDHEDFLSDEAPKLRRQYDVPASLGNQKDKAVFNHGFTRLTYERNNGRLNVESSVPAWTKELRDQIFSYAADHLDDIDNMTVTLFDRNGKIAKQDSAQLFLLDDDAAKLDNLPLITKERTTQPRGFRGGFLPRRRNNFLPDPRLIQSLGSDNLTNAHLEKLAGAAEVYFNYADDMYEGAGDALVKRYDGTWEYVDLGFEGDSFYDTSVGEKEGKTLAQVLGEVPDEKKDAVQALVDEFRLDADQGQSAFRPQVQELGLDIEPTVAPAVDIPLAIRYPEAKEVKYQKHRNGRIKKDANGSPIPIVEEYNLESTPLAERVVKEGGDRDAVVRTFADKVKDLFFEHQDNPEIANGIGWYETTRQLLREKLGDDWDFMAQLLAATSPGTSVDVNFQFAVEAFNAFKQGKFDDIIAKYDEGLQKLKSGELRQEWLDSGRANKKPTDEALIAKWVDDNDLKPRKENGKLFGFHGLRLLQVFTGRWLENNVGPKVRQFYENLAGRSFGATIDVWMGRQLHRIGNEGEARGPWRILPEAETGINGKDFQFGQEVLELAANELDVQPDALQAFLWFLEKDIWGRKGWTKEVGRAKSSFADLLQTVERRDMTLVPIEPAAPLEPQQELGL